MTTNIATTREQSVRLLQCGVDPKTADMCLSTRIRRIDGTPIAKKSQTTNLWVGYPCWRITSSDEELENLPAWSLSALLSLLPKEICDENDNSFYFSLTKELPLTNEYCAVYLPCRDDNSSIVRKRDNDPIEACVQLIEWLIANNYKLNEL